MVDSLLRMVQIKQGRLEYEHNGKLYIFYFKQFFIENHPLSCYEDINLLICCESHLSSSVLVLNNAWLADRGWLPVVERILWSLATGVRGTCSN